MFARQSRPARPDVSARARREHELALRRHAQDQAMASLIGPMHSR